MKYLFSILSIGFFFLSTTSLFADCIYKMELNASQQEDGNFLTWSTSSEMDNQYFVIERSRNGIDFEVAGKVKGGGTINEAQEYSFSDVNKNKQFTRFFYRLVQMNFDGTSAFSHVAVLTRTSDEKLFDITSLNSSIVDQYFNLNLESSISNQLSYNVQTQMGDVLLRGKIQVTKGQNAISIDMNDLEVGRYQFALKLKNEISVIQVKKVDSSELPEVNLATKNKNTKN